MLICLIFALIIFANISNGSPIQNDLSNILKKPDVLQEKINILRNMCLSLIMNGTLKNLNENLQYACANAFDIESETSSQEDSVENLRNHLRERRFFSLNVGKSNHKSYNEKGDSLKGFKYGRR